MSQAHEQYENLLIRLSRNAAKCLQCGDVVESTHVRDFKTCSCGSLSVDGGLEYTRRLFITRNSYDELSMYTQRSKRELDDMIVLYTREELNPIYSDGFYRNVLAACKYYRDLWYPDLTKP